MRRNGSGAGRRTVLFGPDRKVLHPVVGEDFGLFVLDAFAYPLRYVFGSIGPEPLIGLRVLFLDNFPDRIFFELRIPFLK